MSHTHALHEYKHKRFAVRTRKVCPIDLVDHLKQTPRVICNNHRTCLACLYLEVRSPQSCSANTRQLTITKVAKCGHVDQVLNVCDGDRPKRNL